MDIETHLLKISDRETDRNEAQYSISILYDRYKKFVYNITYRNISFTLQKEELALCVVSDVYLKIWESPLNWDFDSTIHETPEDGFKAYLSTIAHFKLLEKLRKIKASRENEDNIIDDGESEWKWALLDEEFDYLDKDLIKKRNTIDECLLEFTERNRDIIRMYFFLYDDEKNMTREKITLMETLFETTWQNIRQIIHRSKRKIKTILEEKLQIK